jgi:DNA-binding response OmpR family regulator
MSQSERVLVVEDDSSARIEMADVLREAGYQVLEAPGGDAALRLALSGDPTVILLDLILPDGAGFELLDRLRSLPKGERLAIVAVSGFEERIRDAKLVGARFDAYLLKPFGTAQLIAAITAGAQARRTTSDA